MGVSGSVIFALVPTSLNSMSLSGNLHPAKSNEMKTKANEPTCKQMSGLVHGDQRQGESHRDYQTSDDQHRQRAHRRRAATPIVPDRSQDPLGDNQRGHEG